MQSINFFEDPNYLEPKCPHCEVKLEYGTNTKYDDKLETHVCLGCGKAIK